MMTTIIIVWYCTHNIIFIYPDTQTCYKSLIQGEDTVEDIVEEEEYHPGEDRWRIDSIFQSRQAEWFIIKSDLSANLLQLDSTPSTNRLICDNDSIYNTNGELEMNRLWKIEQVHDGDFTYTIRNVANPNFVLGNRGVTWTLYSAEHNTQFGTDPWTLVSNNEAFDDQFESPSTVHTDYQFNMNNFEIDENYLDTLAGMAEEPETLPIVVDHKRFLNSLKTQVQVREFISGSQVGCSICLENELDNPHVTSCGHLFCRCCIDNWLNRNHRNCPLCKQTQSTLPVSVQDLTPLIQDEIISP
eukprot:Pgem_evm1s8276